MPDNTQSKIDKLQLGDFVLKLHHDGISHYDISKLIKEKYNESVNGQTVYRWLRTNCPDYIAPKFQSNNKTTLEQNIIKENIDFSIPNNISLSDSDELADTIHKGLLKTFIKLTLIIDHRLNEYNDTNRVPVNEIKALKLVTEIINTITSKEYNEYTHIEIKKSLLGDKHDDNLDD